MMRNLSYESTFGSTLGLPEQFAFWWRRSPLFFDLQNLLSASLGEHWPAVHELQALLNCQGHISFVPHCQAKRSGLYYEQHIATQSEVPTRERNWHDFFNACMWSLFPRSKKQLNRIHIQQLEEENSPRRNPKRDAITLFDECGLVIASSRPQIIQALQQHDWHTGFVKYRHLWGTQIRPYVFGHAVYEQAFRPHQGWCGKAIYVAVNDSFWHLSTHAQYQLLDAQLSQIFSTNQIVQPRDLYPLPLLGVPGWSLSNTDEQYYADPDYFRAAPQWRRTYPRVVYFLNTYPLKPG